MDSQHAVDLIESQLIIPPHRTIKPVLIVMVGLPGVGKSTLAHAVAPALLAAVVESDMVRKTLFQAPTHSGPESAWVHGVARAVIERLLLRGVSVVSDATNLRESNRELLYHLADQCGARLLVVRVVASAELVRQRLERRRTARTPHDLSDATWEVYQRMQKDQEAIRRAHITVDMGSTLEAAVQQVLRAARRGGA